VSSLQRRCCCYPEVLSSSVPAPTRVLLLPLLSEKSDWKPCRELAFDGGTAFDEFVQARVTVQSFNN
jgi:hypothetical protein